MKDKHDPRDFEQFIILNDDGTVAGVKMITVGSPPPTDGEQRVHINVTALGPVPLDAVAIDPALVATVKDKAAALQAATLTHAQAFLEHATAQRIAEAAVAHAIKG